MKAAFAAVLFASTLSVAQSTRDPISDSRNNAIVRTVGQVAPAVVTINVFEIQYERVVDPSFDAFFRFFGAQARTRIRQRPVRAVGTGFIFRPDGYILTNWHVIEGAEYVSVTLPDGRYLDVEYIGGDERGDLAVLRAKGENLPYVSFGDSDDLLIGEWMIAFGNPFGLLVSDPQPTVSVGVVSANHRRISASVGGGTKLYQDMIQTDAAINPGNSGGPLANAAGEVVGVNTFIFSSSGGSVGMGFAIPANRAKRVAEEVIAYGRRRNPWAGFKAIQSSDGVYVYEILRSSPAYQAGLRPSDRVLTMNDMAINRPSDLDYATWTLFVGDDVTLKIEHNGVKRALHFEVEELGR